MFHIKPAAYFAVGQTAAESKGYAHEPFFKTPNSSRRSTTLKTCPTPSRNCLCRQEQCRKIQCHQYPDQPCPSCLRFKNTGRTQHINFFELQNSNFMVDLPGYSYSKSPKQYAHIGSICSATICNSANSLSGWFDYGCPPSFKELDIRMLDFPHISE